MSPPMPNTLWTLLVAVVAAVVTALAVGLFVTPRMEARKKRVGEVHTARDTFGASMLRVISACSLLQRFGIPAADDPDWTSVMCERLTNERNRWWQQLDETTMWLLDNAATYAGSWPSSRIIRLAVDYAGHARAVMLSEREEATKVELLLALTVPVQRQFFGFWWSRVRHYVDDQRAFAETVAHISGEPSAP
ncbi:hypothetical protein RM704_23165 [Streptomyces sp. DSM 3412]|uniref:DUF4760 domain-containing protein n=1 Tax=Streptomyces gottesmaniae TaxID=3075518 RepID=A0ABU2Z2E8_9ACTN|nr:hypothetical protein [Streptomyces sp. DSM 3412]MDT0570333.1 hypothetical protein [Streptomyces sp. DSM 3412]